MYSLYILSFPVLIREKTSLEASITPVLSRESIKILTRGTTYSKYLSMKKHDKEENKEEQTVARTYRLTGLVLTKVKTNNLTSYAFLFVAVVYRPVNDY